MKLLFICTGNTCRSPMAQAIFQHMAAERGLVAVSDSAGVRAVQGAPVSKNAVIALRNLFGIDGFAHASQPVSRELFDEADRIVTLTEKHRRCLEEDFGPSDKIISFPFSVGDPWVGTLEAYEACAAKIKEGLIVLMEKIIKND